MDKNFVTLEKKICPVCCKEHDNDCGLLLDKNLKKIFDLNTVTGYGLCKEHEDLIEQGYIHLVAINPEKSEISIDNTIKTEGAYRTGQILSVKRDLLDQIFKEQNISLEIKFVFIDEKFVNIIKELYKDIIKE